MLLDLHSVHPSSSQILEYWYIYTTHVDPITKILHAPSFGKKLLVAKDNLQSLDDSMAALMFSIYFAAVTTLSADETQKRFFESRDILLHRFKLAIEKALAQTNFLGSPNIMTLQALVIYLVRYHGLSRLILLLL